MSNSSQDRVIRTPDQRLRVFVSSTLQELIEERVGAREAITALRLSPVMFEMGARPHPPRDLYRAYLEQSDVNRLSTLSSDRRGRLTRGPGLMRSACCEFFDLIDSQGSNWGSAAPRVDFVPLSPEPTAQEGAGAAIEHWPWHRVPAFSISCAS